MSGDWIKMRADLFTHPKVVRISSALKADTLRTVGGLMSVWCLFDAHSEDGSMIGYTGETLDDHLRWPGFSAAMMAVGWLSETGESLDLPRFETHNGTSAKRRAQDADRKKEVRKTSASDADKLRTREEKRREEKKEQKQSTCAPPDGEAPPSGPQKSDPIPYQAIATLYNGAMSGLPKVRDMTPKRKTLIRSAWSASKARQDLRFWTAYFDVCAGEPFLNGAGPYREPHANWRPDFDYLLKSDVVTRVFERAMDAMERTT